jgi:hypothetical protein
MSTNEVANMIANDIIGYIKIPFEIIKGKEYINKLIYSQY